VLLSHVKYTSHITISPLLCNMFSSSRHTNSKKMFLELLFLQRFCTKKVIKRERERGERENHLCLWMLQQYFIPHSFPNGILGWFTSQLAHSYSHISTAPLLALTECEYYLFFPLSEHFQTRRKRIESNLSSRVWSFYSLNRQKTYSWNSPFFVRNIPPILLPLKGFLRKLFFSIAKIDIKLILCSMISQMRIVHNLIIFFRRINYLLWSISSTLNAKIKKAFFLVMFWLCMNFHTKNARIKRWWNWHLWSLSFLHYFQFLHFLKHFLFYNFFNKFFCLFNLSILRTIKRFQLMFSESFAI